MPTHGSEEVPMAGCDGSAVGGGRWRKRSASVAAVFAAVSVAALVLASAGGASFVFAGQTVSAVDGSTGTEITVRAFAFFGGSGGVVDWAGNEGFRSDSFIPEASPVAELYPIPNGFFLGLDRRCSQEEANIEAGLRTDGINDYTDGLPLSTCWEYFFVGDQGRDDNGAGSDANGSYNRAGGGAWGWQVPQTATGSDGTTPVVFDHWNLTNLTEMPGLPGYCHSGDRGIQRAGLVAAENWIPEDVSTDSASFQAVYEPADPDVTPPVINVDNYFDCQLFAQNSIGGSIDAAVGDNYDFHCTDPGFEATLTSLKLDGPTGVADCYGILTSSNGGGPQTVHSGDPIDTSTLGDYTLTIHATDGAGNESEKTVTYQVVPDPPGAPNTDRQLSPDGTFTISWSAAPDPDPGGTVTYTLEQENTSQAEARVWSQVATGLESTSYTFGAGGNPAQDEGTWTFRVRAVRSSGVISPYRSSFNLVVVDKTAPPPPTIDSIPPPDYSGGGGWWHPFELNVHDNGDPALPDGSPGSGVDPSSVPGPFAANTPGATFTATVTDRAGHQSQAATLQLPSTMQFDSKGPVVHVSCPDPVIADSTVYGTWTASDSGSGLADPATATGSFQLDTQFNNGFGGAREARRFSTTSETARASVADTPQSCRRLTRRSRWTRTLQRMPPPVRSSRWPRTHPAGPSPTRVPVPARTMGRRSR